MQVTTHPISQAASAQTTRNGNSASSIFELQEFVSRHPNLFVITGAGISHASGIPTYRDANGLWQSRSPIQHKDFMASENTRRRYWSRSYVGWPTVERAQPNRAHKALALLRANGFVQTLVTQNVDRLHQKSGHDEVFDLHGRLDQVVCMQCNAISWRHEMQQRLQQANSSLNENGSSSIMPAPDGDADVSDDQIGHLLIPTCEACDGILKPDVVFFGDSVAKEKVTTLFHRLEQADAILVVGSSLMVYSSFRFCRHAAANSIPMACINQGVTRADELFDIKLNADCEEVLLQLATNLPAG